MSTASDSVKVSIPLNTAIMAFRGVSRSFGSCIEKGNNVFAIKDTVQRTLLSTTYPATVTVTFKEDGEITVILFEAKNLGFGPIQSKECHSRLGAVKSAIINEIEKLSSQQPTQTFSAADELLKYKQLLDMGAISQEEFDKKKKELL